MLEQTLINALLLGMTYVVVASGLTLVFGVMHVFNFAHGELYMLGGFVGYLLLEILGVNFFAAMILTMAVMFFFGVLIEKYAFRLVRGKLIPSMILSLGLSLGLSGFALLAITENDLSAASPFPGVIQLGQLVLARERLMVIVLCFLIMVAMFIFLHRFKWGRAMRAVATDPEAAALQGINIYKIYNLTFAIGSATLGLAGAFLMPYFYVHSSVGVIFTIKAFIVVVLGGMGSITGALLGGFVVGMSESVGSLFVSTTTADLLVFLIFISVLLFKPSGLLGKEE